MAEIGELKLQIERVEDKLDALAQSVDASFVEQREFTEFAFGRLRAEMIRRFDSVDARFVGMDARFDRMDSRFDRLERKLDQFIDTQSHTNALVERRLQGLEPPARQE